MFAKKKFKRLESPYPPPPPAPRNYSIGNGVRPLEKRYENKVK